MKLEFSYTVYVLCVNHWCVLPEDNPKRVEICWSWSSGVLIVKLYILILFMLLVLSYVNTLMFRYAVSCQSAVNFDHSREAKQT